MAQSSRPPEGSSIPAVHIPELGRVSVLEREKAELNKFEVMMLKVNRCLIDAVTSEDSKVLQYIFGILNIINDVCEIRDEFETQQLVERKQEAIQFLLVKQKELKVIAFTLNLEEELVPLKMRIERQLVLLTDNKTASQN